MTPLRLKYQRERLRLARQELLDAAEAARLEPKDRQVGERLDRALDMYRSIRDEVRRLEKQERNHET